MAVRDALTFSGTPLEALSTVQYPLDWGQIRRLHSMSIETVEDLLGVIYADPEAAYRFLGSSVDLAGLQAEAYRVTAPGVQASIEAAGGRRYALGAERPDDIVAEALARPETIDAAMLSAGTEPERQEVQIGADLRHRLGPVRDQGERGTCVAHACCAVMECAAADSNLPDYSEQHLYWNIKQIDRIEREGSEVRWGMQVLKDTGVCLEHIWPYVPTLIAGDRTHNCNVPDQLQAARLYRIDRRQQHPRLAAAIVTELLADRAVALSVPVYQTWYGNPAVHIYGRIGMPLPASRLEGGHAMCVVGYVLSGRQTGGGAFIVRNSWGVDWAPRSDVAPGHGLLPFEYVNKYAWEAFTCQL